MAREEFNAGQLAQFTGTCCWFRHALNRKVLFTEGVKYLAEQAAAHWLLDEIALLQLSDGHLATEGFQVWHLNVSTDMSAELTCEDGNSNVLYTKKIAYTDFPAEAITLWFTDNTILLPSEY